VRAGHRAVERRLLAYGRRPWLSLRLEQLFVNP
jgi:hypothetical protein